MLVHQTVDVYFKYIVVDNGDVGVIFQRFAQYGDQVGVDFHSDHLAGVFGQILRHGADARTDLEHAVFRADASGGNDLVQYVGIDEEILSEFFLEYELVFLYDFDCFFRVAQFVLHVVFLTFSFKVMVDHWEGKVNEN